MFQDDFNAAMKKVIGVGTFALAFLCNVVSAPSPRYENFSILTNVPQIDAVIFGNFGDFSVGTPLPYTTQNTLYYTNRGQMFGSPGFLFQNISDSGKRSWSSSFFNGTGASVQAGSLSFLPPSVEVKATNIINRGLISSDPGGLIRIEGANVDLSRGGLLISAINGSSEFQTETNFFPETGVSDIYWGIGSMPDPVNQNPAFFLPPLLSVQGKSFLVDSGSHAVTNAAQRRLNRRIQLTAPASYVYTNAAGVGIFVVTNTIPGTTNTTTTNYMIATNIAIQAVFVTTRDTNLTTSVTFYNSTIPTNVFKTVVVQLASVETNVVTGGNDFATIYLADRLASETNYNTLTNLSTGSTYIPANFEVARVDPVAFFSIRPLPTAVTNAIIRPDLFYHSSFTNNVTTNTYSSYGFFFTNQLADLPSVGNASITNLPGKVVILADTLNLERTRIRGEGLVSISTKHLESTKSTAIDVQNIYYDLSSTNELLSVQNLSKAQIQRMSGNVFAFSAIWTNQTGFALTNTLPDPADTNGIATIQEIFTNTIDIVFHVLMVDARTVSTRQPTYVTGFHAESRDVVVGDTLRIVESVSVEAQSLTMLTNSALLLGANISDWTDRFFPGLMSLTNHGLISVPGTAFLGTDRQTPYLNVVNSGTNVAIGHLVRCDYFENSGIFLAGQYVEQGQQVFMATGPGGISLKARSVKLDGGRFDAGGDIRIEAEELKMRRYTNNTSSTLVLAVTENLSDSGGTAQNLITATRGVHLVVKPKRGDLLGTTLKLTAARFEAISHTWAGEDRGAKAVGFVDNAAIGKMVLDGGLDSLQEFSGIGPSSAIYVDYLEIGPSYLANLSDFVKINPNFKIYFADSNVPAEELNGALAGKLSWVSEFAGPNSSVDVALGTGKTIKMNRQFIQSRSIDSDGDGIANGFDLTPFGGVKIGANVVSGKTLLTWDAAAGRTYVIEYSVDLLNGAWQLLQNYTHTSEANSSVSIQDTLSEGSSQRYYRIRYNL